MQFATPFYPHSFVANSSRYMADVWWQIGHSYVLAADLGFTLSQSNIAMENGPLINDLPI